MADPNVTKRTFRLELTRALMAGGIIEAFSTTFLLYFLIKVYDANDTLKSAVMSSQRGGLLLGFLVVAFAHRWHQAPSRVASITFFTAAIALAVASSTETATIFAISIAIASCMWSWTPPLVTQFYRANYPSDRRGRLFSLVAIVRGLSAVVIGYAIGRWLEHAAQTGQDLRLALWLAPAAFLMTAVFLWCIPIHPQLKSMGRIPRQSYWAAFHWLGRDKRFALAIIAWMFVGIGMLMSGVLLVEYLANPRYGLAYDSGTISLISIGIPTTIQLATTYVWASWFDKVRFFRLRLVLNAVGAIAVLVIYLSPHIGGLYLGAALLGLFRGGGNIAWNLWVTKLAPEDHVGEYMSVHTFFTGIRGILTPWLGYYLLREHGVSAFAWVCFGFVMLSSITVILTCSQKTGLH